MSSLKEQYIYSPAAAGICGVKLERKRRYIIMGKFLFRTTFIFLDSWNSLIFETILKLLHLNQLSAVI